MNIPNPVIENRILASLVSKNTMHSANYITSPNAVIKLCTPGILEEQKVNSADELVELLFDMSQRGLLSELGMDEYSLSDDGLLLFKRYLTPFENPENYKQFDKILDKSNLRNDVKQATRKLFKSLKGNTAQEIFNLIIEYMKNPYALDALMQTLEYFNI